MSINSTLPNNYLKNKTPYFIKIPNGIPVSFFINSEPVLNSEFNFANLRLALIGQEGLINNNVHPLLKVDVTGSSYRVYAVDLVLTGLKPDYEYYFVVYDSLDDRVLFVMDCFKFAPDTTGLVYLSYRNSTDLNNFNYEALPNYRNNVFVDLNLIDSPPEYNIESYDEASTNDVRTQKTKMRYSVTLEGYFFDNVADDAMKGFSLHDDIQINFREYKVAEGWVREPNIRNVKSKGKITMYDQKLNTINFKS